MFFKRIIFLEQSTNMMFDKLQEGAKSLKGVFEKRLRFKLIEVCLTDLPRLYLKIELLRN